MAVNLLLYACNKSPILLKITYCILCVKVVKLFHNKRGEVYPISINFINH